MPTAAPTTSSGDVRLETHGGAILNILRSAGPVAEAARAHMKAAGLWHEARPTVPEWFSLDVNLRLLADLERTFGEDALVAIGRSVPEHATFPPGIRTLHQALTWLDRAFHRNHRRDGQVMFDPDMGTMLEGIGHYGCEETPDGLLVVASTSVYPCRFDHGVVLGFVTRFAPTADVRHPPPEPGDCRSRGASSCRYIISFRDRA